MFRCSFVVLNNSTKNISNLYLEVRVVVTTFGAVNLYFRHSPGVYGPASMELKR
jgi:hypothetical protein